MQKVHQYNRICMQAKSQFLKAKIQDNHNNPQKLWRVLGDVLHRLPAKILPAIKPPQLSADSFVEFFTEKIEKIRSTFSASANLQHITPDSPPPMFSTFSTVTEDQVTKVSTSSPSKSCSLDPWPTFLVLDYLDILITPITSIINASLEQGKSPNFFKQAHVTPILKRGWFKSYLSGRTHSVKVGSTLSHPAALHYGVPQGSVLGPILFSLYNNPIGSIIHSHSSINYHFYADDTQLYITFSPENFSHSIQKLKNHLNDIQNFMFANKLKLNPDKTEFILIGSRKNRNQLLPHFPINILGNQVSPAQSVRNLGVVFDSNFTFSNHVSQVIKSTRVQARDLYRIRPLLDLNTSVLLANALVSSRLDYCNSLFLSLTDFELRRLQLVQNSLFGVVTRSSKFSHITPQLKKLHWLPVRYRVQFKIGLITYKILTQGQPVYLRGLIHPYTSFRNTRRSTPKLKFLQTPTFDRRVHKSIKHFSNSFSHYTPAFPSQCKK